MARDVKINIGTTADTSGIDKAKASLVGLKADVPSSLGALDISGLTAALGKAAPVIAGIAAAWSTAAKAVSEYSAAEQEMAKLDAALANSASLTGEYRAQLQGLASDLQNSTGIADEKWTAALTTLTKFGADSTNIDQYSEAVKNLAGFLGGDIEQAAFLFGKAMQGSTEMLGRYGIEVDKSATQTAQLDSIMAQLAQRGGGQLEAQAGTLTGQWNQLTNATSDIFESFGGLIAQTQLLQATMDGVTGILRAVNDAMGISIPQTEGLSNKFIQQAASADQLKLAVDAYRDTLTTTTEASTSAQAAANAEIEVLDRQTTAALDLAKAQKELALAKVEADSSLNAEQKATARAGIEKNFASTEIAAQVNLAKDKVAARENAIRQIEDAATARRAEIEAQRQRTEAARAKQAASQASGDKLARLTDDETKIQAELQKVRNTRSQVTPGLSGDGGQLGRDLDTQIRNYETALARINDQKSGITDADKNARAAADIEAAKLQDLEAQTAAEDKKSAALAARLARENEADKSRAETASNVAEIEAQTADVKSSQAIAAAKSQDEEIARKKRLLDLELAINEAKATGNTTELARLQALKAAETATANGLTPDQARRSANAAALQTPGITPASAPYVPPGTQGGDLFSGTTRRKGVSSSDAFNESALNLAPGESLLDQYKANQSRPVGSVNGQSILPADPASSAKGGNAEGLNAAADKYENSGADVAGLGDQIAASLDKVISATEKKAADLTQLKTGLQAAHAKIDALAAKV